MKKIFRINSSNTFRSIIIEAIMNAPVGYFVTVGPRTRTELQNEKFHAMCGDVARQVEFNGRMLTLQQWKVLFVSAHAKATGEDYDLEVGLEGELVNLRESTAQMGVKRMASLIEYVQAWASENDVVWSEKS